jgi:hypothetical protein
MANLTTLDSMQYLFDPGAIAAIADRDELTGADATVVYGLAPQGLKATESVDALLRRLGLASAFAKLTRPDGSSILIHGGSVSVVRRL